MNKEELITRWGAPTPVGVHGHVRLVDCMGDDSAIVQAARVSYGAGTKTPSDDRTLIRYLMRHRHCYHPDMEVLTSDGWKRWADCKYEEVFLVPDPKTKSLTPEKLQLEVFDADEEMQYFENSRMSYCVTSDHRMWFKNKYSNEFEIVQAAEMNKWGHFDPAAGYTLVSMNEDAHPLGRLVGFTLGDGSWSGNGLSFHLRKSRKMAYLRTCLADLGITATESQSSTYSDAIVFYVNANAVANCGLLNYIRIGERAHDKQLIRYGSDIKILRGIFDGLINSDSHINSERNNRIEFSSVSENLLTEFETLAALHGYDAHRIGEGRVNAYPPGRTSLEARPNYFSTRYYRGKVYCATTSTGLLMVRGGSDKFAFVCGNTTPLEMCEIKFHLKLPIHVARQLIR